MSDSWATPGLRKTLAFTKQRRWCCPLDPRKMLQESPLPLGPAEKVVGSKLVENGSGACEGASTTSSSARTRHAVRAPRGG